ncbi:prenyltransferase/squalene oxidase repeat-containing protein [Arthrobacter globiformis]|uniref:prenyltransferase/squalene oxidase repeat-containing protein n=1 Tax=Arthrobacter globiformis TaxID=1665 RepID=UPI00278F8BF8|nr:prenyltransferase/squalene oxidase repeat-containing protein [Arthrobacter globiformis]MDQ0620118.1 hypothetical protein [Arthrobacter globiformis]
MNDDLKVRASALHALDFAKRHDFAGADPYDGLTSPLAKLLVGRLPRQAWQQVIKRSNLTIRAMTGIRPVRMAKATALFAEGLWLLGRQDEARLLGDRLLASQAGGPWGYEFDVQTRWAHYRAGTPNVIATAFVIRALAVQKRLDEVNPEVLEWLYSLIDPRGYFHYTPASSALIHNGNLLAAETVARMGGDLGAVRAAAEITLQHQSSDGSWAYGEGSNLSWIDNFHTVYVLESLSRLADYEIGSRDQLKSGIDYWHKSLLSQDRLPFYYAGDRSPSTDVHNIATVVGGLSKFKDPLAVPGHAHPTVQLLLSHQGPDGGFRDKPGSVPYMRWNQAHAFCALAKVMVTDGNGSNGTED